MRPASAPTDSEPHSDRPGRMSPRFVRWSIAATSFTVLVGTWAVASIRANGHLTFVFDDPYIHLSIADTLAHDGTWGVAPGEYESGSSSPGWVLLLAAGIRLGLPGVAVGFALAFASGLWALWTFSGAAAFDRLGTRAGAYGAAVIAPFSLSLVALVAMGMEHILHVALVLHIVSRLATLVGSDGLAPVRARIPFGVLLAAATAIRFETLAVATAAALAYVWWQPDAGMPRTRRRIGTALGWIASSIAPIGAVAAVNVAFGQFPMPDSVIAKGWFDPQPDRTPLRPLQQLAVDPRLGVMVVLAGATLLLARPTRRSGDATTLIAVLIAAGAFLTAGPVTMTWLGRYQVFAIDALALGVLACAGGALATHRRTMAIAIIAVAAAFPLPFQLAAQQSIIEGSGEIHRHHELAATFLNQHYPGRSVALNDVGVIGYTYDGEIVDLLGLVSHEVLLARIENRFDRAWVTAHLARTGTTIAVGYPGWIGPLLPVDWRLAGTWCLDHEPAAAGDRCQNFFAAPTELDGLRRNLQAFAPSLPIGVTLRLA